MARLCMCGFVVSFEGLRQSIKIQSKIRQRNTHLQLAASQEASTGCTLGNERCVNHSSLACWALCQFSAKTRRRDAPLLDTCCLQRMSAFSNPMMGMPMAYSAAACLANQKLLLVAHVCLLKANGGEVHGVFLNLSLELLDLGHIIAVHIGLKVLQLGTSAVLVLQLCCNLDRPAGS